MPRYVRKTPHEPFPTRGVPGGWVDWWDDPDDAAAVRAAAEAAERRLLAEVQRISTARRAEIAAEQAAS